MRDVLLANPLSTRAGFPRRHIGPQRRAKRVKGPRAEKHWDSVRAHAALPEVVAALSHDLRNSLSVVVVNSRLLSRSFPNEGQVLRHLDAITRAAQGIYEVLDDWTDVLNTERGRFALKYNACALSAIVDGAIATLQPLVAVKSFVFNVDLEQGDIVADEKRVARVLAVLLENAIRCAPKDSCISLRSFRKQGQVHFSVTHRGPTVALDLRPYLFSRSLPSGRRGQGIGVPFFLANAIVTAHGGSVAFDDDEGVTFAFRLPVAPQL